MSKKAENSTTTKCHIHSSVESSSITQTQKSRLEKKTSISGVTLHSAICLASISLGACRSIRRRISHCSIRCSISCLCSCHCRLSASMNFSCCCRTSTLCWVLSHWFFSLSTAEGNTQHEKYEAN